MVVFGQKLLYSGKSGCIRAKKVLFGPGFCILAEVVVFGQNWLYSSNSGCIKAKVIVFGQKWLYSGKVVIFGQSDCIRAKWLISGKSGFLRSK